jgi:hypothetical protein
MALRVRRSAVLGYTRLRVHPATSTLIAIGQTR